MKNTSLITTFFSSPSLVFTSAAALRIVLLLWGRYQDTHSPLKYTDIDYLVFTDAARAVSRGQSPYVRETYRYTPLLAWLLLPTSWAGAGGWWFDFGKVVFSAGDLLTGWLIYLTLRSEKGTLRGGGVSAPMSREPALKYASIWLLNPMVANISTRGSSEGLLAVIVVALLWAVLNGRVVAAGLLLGLGVHFKIYPFVYAVSIFWWLDRRVVGSWDGGDGGSGSSSLLRGFLHPKRVQLALFSLIAFMGLNFVMLNFYGLEFVQHSYSYHLIRIDHRHNFSVYNTLLHLKSAMGPSEGFAIESLAFVPQLLLSVVAIPLALAKKDLASTMLAQTFAFVTFNKVCTSQYFLWYMVFLPFYLPDSSLLRQPKRGWLALGLWVVGQAVWLQQAASLEFFGQSTFVPGLWLASMLFFGINCWILGVVIGDINDGASPPPDGKVSKSSRHM
ncbi:hypothetical protein AAFC00_006402 [Neodothiora populina]|uniref:GPI mannosyltransferase 1 n=1 Tax=Neodothiora populina TaxID=2781224 RepID=A0ABR3P5A9_9PEZI